MALRCGQNREWQGGKSNDGSGVAELEVDVAFIVLGPRSGYGLRGGDSNK
jgi:hypothetical protein